MVAIVFGGPSLQGIGLPIPDIVVLPPAAQGDVLAALRKYHPAAIGILDCDLPYRSLPTWHKEILYALDSGVRVVGAAAVGAHRAAELASFGMEGAGSIFRRVASGELERDDEVLGDWEMTGGDVKRLSVPLVAMRDVLDAAATERILPETAARALTRAAEGLFWRRRTWEALLESHAATALSGSDIERFREWLPGAPDPVRADADALLRRVRELAEAGEARRPGAKREYSAIFRSLEERDRPVDSAKGPLRQWCIGDMVTFAHPEAEDLNGRALNRKLVLLLAAQWNLEPEEHEIASEEKRLRRRFRLKTDEEFVGWKAENDLDDGDIRRLLEEEALIHRLHRWFMQGRVCGKNTDALLDELRLRGGYPEWKQRAANREAIIRDNEDIWREEWRRASIVPFMQLAREHLRSEGFPWCGAMLPDVIPETGMEPIDLIEEFLAAKTAKSLWSGILGASSPAGADKGGETGGTCGNDRS